MRSALPRFLFIILFSCVYSLAHAQPHNGMVITKDEKGAIREKGQMDKGRREGEWNFYDSAGKLEQQINYLGGKKNGAEIHFLYGDTVSLSHYTNDIATGEWKRWS